jgi:hypothetical protein
MKFSRQMLAFAAIFSISITQPAYACWTDSEADAASVANLNMMMMVTALRCRSGDNNFLTEYNHFVQRNNSVLGAQNAILKARFSRIEGVKAAEGATDRFTIGLANHYGAGDTNMGCQELKQLAGDLATKSRDSEALIALALRNAGEPTLPGGRCSSKIAGR